MGRPYPVPVQITTVYTESRGNVEVSTVELKLWDGTIKYETALFWTFDDKNPYDMGSVVVEVTYKKSMAYRNHKWWDQDVHAIESRIYRAIADQERIQNGKN